MGSVTSNSLTVTHSQASAHQARARKERQEAHGQSSRGHRCMERMERWGGVWT